MTTRESQGREAAERYKEDSGGYVSDPEAFMAGVKWADQNPSPEVMGLVEALERIRDSKDKCHGMIIADMGYAHFAKKTAGDALDAFTSSQSKEVL